MATRMRPHPPGRGGSPHPPRSSSGGRWSTSPGRARSARGTALPQLSSRRPPSGGRGARAGSGLPKALMDPSLLAQTVKQASDEANIARIDRDAALHARDNMMQRLAMESQHFDAERQRMVKEVAEKQAELDSALELARSAKATIEAQTRDLKARVRHLEAEQSTREAEHQQTTSKLSETVKRQKGVLNQLTSEFEESHTLLQDVSDKEKAGLKAEVSKLRKQLLNEMQNRSGAHEQLESIKADMQAHEARVEAMKVERDAAKFRGDELFREMDALKIQLEAAKTLQVREHAEADEREKVIRERLPALEKAATDADAAREAMVTRALEAEAALSEVLRENETVRYDLFGAQKERAGILAELKAKQDEARERATANEHLRADLEEARALAGVASKKSAETISTLQADLKQTKQDLDMQTERADAAEDRVNALRDQMREAKSVADDAATKARRDYEAEILSWQERNVAALSESSLLQKENAAQQEQIAKLEQELADHKHEVQFLKIETMDHHSKSQKATLEAVQHMNRKDVEILATTSTMTTAADKLRNVLKVVEADRDKMILERDGAYAEITTHELALEQLRGQLEQEQERAAELDRLLKVQELQAEQKLDAARLTNIAAVSALREELGNEARTKEEALYALVLELSAKLQKLGADEADATLSESITGALDEDEGPGVLLATLPPSEEGAEYTDEEDGDQGAEEDLTRESGATGPDRELAVSTPMVPEPEPEPAAELQPAGEPEPAAELQPAGEPEPAAELQPAAEPEPAAELQPAAEPELAAELQPAGEPELAAEPELASEAQLESETVLPTAPAPEPAAAVTMV